MWIRAEEKGFLRSFQFTGKSSKNPKIPDEGKGSAHLGR